MLRYAFVSLLLVFHAGILLPTACADSRTELEKRLLDHLNDRMYGCCQAVVLTSETGNVYEGFVRFQNGRRTDLRVTVSNEGIEYALGDSASGPPAAEPPKPPQAEQKDLRAVIDRQSREIARLKRLLGQQARPEAIEPGQGREPSAGEPNSPPDADPNGFAEPVTRDMYDRIEKGMLHADVVEVLGPSGMLLSSSHFDGALNEIYVWTNADDSHVCVVLQDSHVLVRTQFGLDKPIR